MKWENRQRSSNVEDRRSQSYSSSGGGGGAGIFNLLGLLLGRGKLGGIGIIILIALFVLSGGNPLGILNQSGETVSYTSTAADEEKVEFLSVVLKDTEDVWHQVFNENNLNYKEPKMVIFHGQVQSACGLASAATGPFYCPADQKLYIDLDFFDELSDRLGAPGDFAISYVVAHEVGHHVQNLLGILGEKQQLRKQLSETAYNKISVAIELQADYLAGVFARRVEQKGYLENGDIEEAMNATKQIGDDTLQKKFQGTVVPDSFTHGTSEMRKRWFYKGYNAGDFSEMDTFGYDYDDL